MDQPAKRRLLVFRIRTMHVKPARVDDRNSKTETSISRRRYPLDGIHEMERFIGRRRHSLDRMHELGGSMGKRR
ncbi:hypothetical protein EON65_24055 [archaeon]|nr:MAG: hypothetical protein EON65_24055 [archaeon]